MNQDLVDRLAAQAGIQFTKRRSLDDTDPLGYLESDADFVLNNLDAVVELIEHGGLDKFAELIVRECMKLYLSIDNGNKPHGTDDYTLAIDRHFGVEE